MAVLLHFFFLSAFAWMLVEGLHLYSMVVKVFGSEGSKHFYYYGIGWGEFTAIICSDQTLILGRELELGDRLKKSLGRMDPVSGCGGTLSPPPHAEAINGKMTPFL